MKFSRNVGRRLSLCASLVLAFVVLGLAGGKQGCGSALSPVQSALAADAPNAAGGMEQLKLVLPDAAFEGTPPQLTNSPNIEPISKKPRPLMMVPVGLKNIARGSTLTCSDKNATPETLAKVIDGDKQANDSSIIYVRKGTQWVQLDLGAPQEVFAIVIWHAHDKLKVFHDVVVQVSDDPAFATGVQTLFNNDMDNSSGQGVGTDREYWETREGKLIDAKGAKGRYLRCYSKGNSEAALNQYTEIEVYGRPAAK